ncbi:MAG: hypothetical protein WKF77_29375 [Planctomycetaceae bacterium]
MKRVQRIEATMIAIELDRLETLADLFDRSGNVPLARIPLHSFPGTATVADVLRLCDREPKSLCELSMVCWWRR